MQNMSNLKVTLVQTTLHWEDKESNLKQFDNLISNQTASTDLIVLPEMFSTGFSMQTKLAETMDGDTIKWMKGKAKKLDVPFCGSLMMDVDGKFVNRFVWVNPNGTIQYYDKRHLFSIGNEHTHYSNGANHLVIDYKNWKLLIAICYDLRFPVWLRRTPTIEYDAMVIVANWPERRSNHWRTLLQARAIENQCYVIAVNRVGIDGNGVSHSGNSGLISPTGEWINEYENDIVLSTVQLFKNEVNNWRSVFQVANDADLFNLA